MTYPLVIASIIIIIVGLFNEANVTCKTYDSPSAPPKKLSSADRMASQSNGLFIATFKVVSIQWCQNYHLKVMMMVLPSSYLDFSLQMKFIKIVLLCYAKRLINQNEHHL